jgi:signal peptidase I
VTTDDRDTVPDDEDSLDESGGAAVAEQPKKSGKKSARKSAKKHLPVWQESILLLGIALVLAVVIKAFFVQAFYIPSESMEPGLVKNDRILVEKWSYWGSAGPERGDVVVFEDPGDWLEPDESDANPSPVKSALEKVGLYPAGGHLVKRVIGVAGDTITCCDSQGRISVNGVPLNEPYLKNSAQCNGPMIGCHWTAGPVPEGHIFVMGDHRDMSADSSYHMCRVTETECVPGDEYVPTDLVVGKVFVLVWPRDHFRWIKRPATFADLATPASG